MKFNNQEVLVGADPEVFIKKGGSFVSAFGLVQGNKTEPSPVKDGSVQVDGMALEFNINPAANVQEFVHNVESVYSQLREQVPPDYEFSDQATALFNFNYFSERSTEEVQLGCEADYNAYTGTENTKPDQKKPIRTAGGHIHIGWQEWGFLDEEHIEKCRRVVKACDFYLGLPSILYDSDTDRRSMYGQAGCFRPKTYGVEYRTLSNAWIHSTELLEFVYSSIEQMMANESSWDQMFETDIQDVINTSDTTKALELINKFNIPVFGG